jgi:Tfp pilus assembly protein FimT
MVKTYKKEENLKGFSLLEIIVTVGILLLFSGIIFPFTITKIKRTQLQSYASEIVADIYFQQQEARNRNQPTGIFLESGQYTLFTGETYETATEKDKKELKKGTYLSSIMLNDGTSIRFEGSSFKPLTYGSFLLSNGRSSVKIEINKEGLVEYE